MIEAAERAAGAGNYPSAETLLREAARVQEASLGPLHPDLANTLNNLGIVCENTGKPADAEQFFRRAVAIATTALDPDHPFATTSRKNLRDFCEARGIQVNADTPAPEARSHDPEAESKRLFTRVALGALGPIAMLMVILAAGLPRLGAPELIRSSPPIALDEPKDVAPPLANVSVEPVVTPQEASSPARPIVVKAGLCAALDDWLCDPSDRPVPPGPLFFYTQVASTTDTTVQHRWYLDNRLYYTVDLRILASPTIGYRAFSRNRMSSEIAGSWRVEVRSEDGTLMHEERFTVR
jgi:hypothetical protein